MQETRRMRLQSAIQEELAQFVAREVKDPRIPPVTFTDVQVTQDGSHATIFVAILGGAQGGLGGGPALSEEGASIRMKDCLDGLATASGFIRRHLARVLGVRHVPTLSFREDRGFENSTRVHELLYKLQHGENKPE
jgi:ribosome-binding factor A